MKYLIGELLREEVLRQGKPFRVYALERNCGDTEFAAIRAGNRAVSSKKLKTLLDDTDKIKEPVLNEIRSLLDTLDTDTLVEVYNVIYNRIALGKV